MRSREIAKRTGRAVALSAALVAAVSFTVVPDTAYAQHRGGGGGGFHGGWGGGGWHGGGGWRGGGWGRGGWGRGGWGWGWPVAAGSDVGCCGAGECLFFDGEIGVDGVITRTCGSIT